jgi:NADP-dependent 3-hydroxy acid dehydrogenase YdfG
MPPTMTSLSVLITGAASGIGAATARLAVAHGHRVALADVDRAGAEALAAELGPQALAVGLDVRDAAQWDAALQATVAGFGRLDVLVNNAGIIHTGYARDLTLSQHRDMVEVNYLGVIGGVMAALPLMRARGQGHIVNVCSMTSFLPLAGYATYGGTKHAMRAFHHSVAIEERNGPVAFTIIHPPAVRTRMLEQEMADDSAVLAFAEKSVAPEEIAETIVGCFTTRPREVIFPKVMGRVQQIAGVFPSLMHEVIPRTEAKARRNRTRLQGR